MFEKYNSQPYNKSVFMTTHNSYRWSITKQLNHGIRGFELDIHDWDIVREAGSWDKIWTRFPRYKIEFYFKIGHAWPGNEVHNKKRGGNPWGNNLEDWLRKIADWSRDHEPHAPITVFLDLKKNLIDENNNPPEQYGLIRFNEQIRKACGDRFITPESFDANTKIKELQNKIIVVLMSFHILSRKLKEVEQKKPIFFIRPITTLLRWFFKLPQQLVIQPIGAMKTRIAYQKGRIKKDNDFNPLCCVAFNPEDRGIPGFEASLEDKSIFVTAYDKKYATYQGKGKLVRTDYKQKDGKWPRDFPDYVNFPATDTWKKKDKYHEQTKDWVKDKWMKWWSVEAKQAPVV